MASTGHSTSQNDDQFTLDVTLLSEINRKLLVDAFNSVNGAKTLVLDPALAGPLGLVTEVALFKQHGVDKMFWLEPGPLTSSTPNVVYLCRPSIKHIKVIADHIKRHARESRKHVYTLLLVPRVSTLVSQILEEEGVLGDVNIGAYNLQFIPLASDVISLEDERAFKEIWVDGDETIVFDSAQALTTIQRLYGRFPRIVGKGDCAGRLAKLLQLQSPATANSDNSAIASDKIDCLVILDRRVDMITPLLTQLTYEGLIDEVFTIKHSHVELPTSLLSPPTPAGAGSSSSSTSANVSVKKESKKKHHLTAMSDPLFAELRDLNFSSVGKRLNKVARRLDENYKTNLQSKTVAQLRDFVGKLGGLQSEHQSLRLHTGLSELIVPHTHSEQFNKSLEIQQTIEELISQGADLRLVIRLLCLVSVTSGGIKTKVLENIKREVLQSLSNALKAYGYEYLPLLLALSDPSLAMLLPNPLPASMVSVPLAKYPYTSLRKSLRLLIDDSPEALEEVENDISYVYSGYAPVSVRLVQCIAQKGGVLSNPAEKERANINDDILSNSGIKAQAHPIVGWKGFEDIVATIPGETVDMVQNRGISSPPLVPMMHSERTTTTVVFFIGGCTYTEISALRWVGRQNRGRRFLIATTGIISGASVIDSIAGIGNAAGTKGIQ
ncbi:hypothetical protein AMATHDRAFT_46418 [Amanita thiersii Skay4041]|uniref:Sec1-like protein n=1 Tax=Amanita thiersii Skay4041 TaxID=703135 RepID=A0A2A9NMT4_9AGAR|nr:hypothetical protein AMATHDRAFT_46418 [Amanita thiersii Skay4041]